MNRKSELSDKYLNNMGYSFDKHDYKDLKNS